MDRRLHRNYARYPRTMCEVRYRNWTDTSTSRERCQRCRLHESCTRHDGSECLIWYEINPRLVCICILCRNMRVLIFWDRGGNATLLKRAHGSRENGGVEYHHLRISMFCAHKTYPCRHSIESQKSEE